MCKFILILCFDNTTNMDLKQHRCLPPSNTLKGCAKCHPDSNSSASDTGRYRKMLLAFNQQRECQM